MIITLDIETRPTTDEAVIEEIGKSISAPGNMKKKETIDKWFEENYQTELEKAVKKTALDPLYGSVRMIGYAIDDYEPVVITDASGEKEIIWMFINEITSTGKVPKIVGHNVQDFDIDFWWKRAIILGVNSPGFFSEYRKRYSPYVYDTMKEWAGYGKYVKLDTLAKALLGEGKSGSGEDSLSMTDEECAKYCAQDVELARKIYKRMIG